MSVRSPPRRKRRNLPRAERREQILTAALVAFSRRGYHGTHVEDVVREAGVARGTFYLHFDSKHAVFAALVDRMLGIFLASRPPDVGGEVRTRAQAERVLRSSYRVVLGTFREHRALARLLFDEAVGLEKGFRERLEAHEREWHARVAATLERFAEAGIARADLDVETTAEMVVGMVERIARRSLFSDEEPDMDRLVEALVRFEMGGITGKAHVAKAGSGGKR